MQYPAIIRRGWRRGLRNSAPVRSMERARLRAVLLASTSLMLLSLLGAPVAIAAAGRAQPARPPGYLGIEFHDLTNEQATALHLRDNRGVEVMLVDHDGPAASAGLKPHDLITGFNGHIVASGEALRRMIHDAGAGVQVRLSVFRNGSPITIHTKLADRQELERKAWARINQASPPPPTALMGVSDTYPPGLAPPQPSVTPRIAPSHSQNFIESMLHGPFTGLMMEAMEPQLCEYFGAPKGEGLLVKSVEDGSPAAIVGIHAGDVILRADSQPMHSTSDFSKRLHASKGKPMALDILRNHQPLTVTLQPDTKKH